MDVCSRCNIKIADFFCSNCQSKFCGNCDAYIHSLSSNQGHNRTYIKKDYLNLDNTSLPSTYQSSPKRNCSPSKDYYSPNKSFERNCSPCKETNQTQKFINEIKCIYENEKKKLLCEIERLNCEMCNYKKTCCERIEFLHQHINDMQNKHNLEMKDLSEKIMKDSCEIIKAKDNEICKLINELQNEKMINEKLCKKISEDEFNFNNEKNQLCSNIKNLQCEIDNLVKSKLESENFYNNKINEINNMYENEKKKYN